MTDNTTRLTVKANGTVVIGTPGTDTGRVNLYGKLGVGVTNVDEDVSLSTSGPIKIQNKKMQTGVSSPDSGNYRQGDIVWNTNPKPTGWVGWICIREGTPAYGNLLAIQIMNQRKKLHDNTEKEVSLGDC